MKKLTQVLLCTILTFMGLSYTYGQVDMQGFENLFNTAVATEGSSVGGGGTGSSTQNTQDKRDGGGSMDMINANWPATGKMIIRKTKLTWDEGIQPTQISVKQGSNEVFKAPVSGNSFVIDFAELNLQTNKSYNIQLSNEDKSSRRTAIRFVEPAILEKAMTKLEDDIVYKKTDGIKKKLMKAFYLESQGFNYEAFEAYHISTADPKDMKVILTFFNEFKNRT